MANTQELMLRIRGDNTDAERKLGQTEKSVEGLDFSARKASSAMKVFGRDLLNVRDTSDLLSAATRALGTVIAGSLGGTAVIVAGKALIDAYRSVQDSAKEAEKSISSVRKSAEKIGAGEGLQSTAGAAKALFAESEKVAEKLKEIESNKLKNFIAGITGARERMAELVSETEKQAKALERQGIVNTLVDMERLKNLSDTDKAVRQIAEKYQPIIDAARAIGDAELLNRTILQAQGEQVDIIRRAKEKDAAEEKIRADARAKQDEDNAKQNELDEIRRLRNLERVRTENERLLKIAEERIRQEETMSDIAEARLRFERLGEVFSGKGGATKFNLQQANQSALIAGTDVLGATRAGRQALEVARKQRERDVMGENFRMASRISEKDRTSMAAQIARGEMPTIAERAGGQERLNLSLERLISLIETAPLVTSGAGAR